MHNVVLHAMRPSTHVSCSVAFHFIIALNLPLIQPDLQIVQLAGLSDPRYAQSETNWVIEQAREGLLMWQKQS